MKSRKTRASFSFILFVTRQQWNIFLLSYALLSTKARGDVMKILELKYKFMKVYQLVSVCNDHCGSWMCCRQLTGSRCVIATNIFCFICWKQDVMSPLESYLFITYPRSSIPSQGGHRKKMKCLKVNSFSQHTFVDNWLSGKLLYWCALIHLCNILNLPSCSSCF